MTHFRDSVIFISNIPFTFSFTIRFHGTKLIYIERTAKPAQSFLLEDGRSAIVQFDKDIAQQY